MSGGRPVVDTAAGAGALPTASHLRTRRRRIVAHVATVLFFGAGASAAFADIWTYQLVGSTFKASGRIAAEGSHMAIACSAVLSVCLTYDCNQCHTVGSGNRGNPSRAFDESRHWGEYFPQRTIAVPPGPPLALGGLWVEQRDGRLTVLDRQRQPLFRLPPGAIVLGDRSRSPAYIVWRGQQPPEVIR